MLGIKIADRDINFQHGNFVLLFCQQRKAVVKQTVLYAEELLKKAT